MALPTLRAIVPNGGAPQTCAATGSAIMRRRPAAAHRTCRPSLGRPWQSRCAPRTRPARCCAGSQDRHAARTAQAGSTDAVSVTPAMPSISASTSARRTSSRFFSISRSCNISVLTATWAASASRARRLPPLAPQVSQVGNAALVEREAVTLPLDHAFGFELADVGPAAIEVLRQCRRADGRGLCWIAVERQAWRRAGDQW